MIIEQVTDRTFQLLSHDNKLTDLSRQGSTLCKLSFYVNLEVIQVTAMIVCLALFNQGTYLT